MQADSCTKLQKKGLSAIINFCKDLIEGEKDSSILLPYSELILSTINNLFQKGVTEKNYYLLEETLNCLSMIAVVIEDDFAKYYNSFMPNLKQLLQNLPADSPQQINIRVLTIESIGFLLCAVKKNPSLFEGDCKTIMESLINLQSQNLKDDDSHHQSILSVYAHVAEALKENFAGYMNFVSQKVFHACDLQVDFYVEDETENKLADLKEKLIKTTIDLKLFGGKKTLALNPALIEHKIAGFQTLLALCKCLGKEFFPYLQKTCELVAKYMSFNNSSVRIIFFNFI